MCVDGGPSVPVMAGSVQLAAIEQAPANQQRALTADDVAVLVCCTT